MILIQGANSIDMMFSATLEFLGLRHSPLTLSMAQGRRLVSHRWRQTNQHVGLECDEQARMHPVSGCRHCSQRIHRRLGFCVLAHAVRYRDEACPVPHTMAFPRFGNRFDMLYVVICCSTLVQYVLPSIVEQFNPIHRAMEDIELFIVACGSISSHSTYPFTLASNV